ncbi:Hydroxyacylglutathione hydrolase [Aquimixticola soesokkakensis]|uniref:Hydroxyacylglutathione hydrolase n=1 Tax=Aquimixticola soesokkakensis TaxID=1519096 RepID=A0A1Y5RLP0_9RHOB|nr:hydroxyacylglutathione hydrolase [Aquimixticola soesokkakensis]SLN20374.1 Hydroxyacylglutathione hydrolase [Aquimixticola soesokkakensis]
MPLEIVTLATRSDNYNFLVHDEATGRTALVDSADPQAILDALKTRGWDLHEVWLTHHHADHTDGIAQIVTATGAQVVGAKADAHRLPPLDQALAAGDSFNFVGHEVHVMGADGHTLGHIAFHIPDSRALFSADSLMALGCGRLFEGTPAQMWETLTRFAALPSDTVIYSGHEYTAANARFAQTIEPENSDLADRVAAITAARAKGVPTVPSTLAEELATNPFLRAHLPHIKDLLDMSGAQDVDAFTEIRARKDRF